MKMETTSFRQIRDKTEKVSADPQERNKLWWNELPMTYSDWDAVNRIPETADDFGRIEKDFLKNNPWLTEVFDFSKFEGQNILEIGCGSGVASCLFARHGAKVTAIDLTEKSVEISKANAKAQGVQMEILCMDAENMSFRDGVFDYVFSWGVLHHSRDTFAAFKEVARVLKVGGKGLIMVYHRMSMRYYLLGLYYLIVKGKIFKYNLRTVQQFFTDGYYHRHFTRRELRKVLNDAGLLVRDVYVSDLQAHYIALFSRKINMWLRRRLGWFLIAEFGKDA